MRITKYIISAVLIVAALIMVGEIHTWQLSEFETRYTKVTFYPAKGTDAKVMTRDVENAADKAGVKVFVVDRKVKSLVSETVDIYGTEGVTSFLRKDIDLEAKGYRSILLGDIDVHVRSLEDTPDITAMEEFFVIGSDDAAVLFKQELVNTYAGAFPERGYESFNASADVIGIWIGVLVSILLLSGFEVSRCKKELLIRMVSGENLTDIVIRRTVADMVMMNIIFIAAFKLTGICTEASFRLQDTLLCWSAFCIADILLHLSALRVDLRKMAGKARPRFLLTAGYIYCGILSLVAVVVMTGSAASAADGLDCVKQKDFFQEHKDSSYVMISLDYNDEDYGEDESDWPDTKLARALYRRELAQDRTCTMVAVSGLTEYSDSNYIFADKGALGYLRENIPEVRDADLKEGVYIISPENYRRTGNKEDESGELAEFYAGEKAVHSMTYSSSVKLTAVECDDSRYEGVRKKDPVIILCNKESYDIDTYVFQGVMFDMDDGAWNRFIKKNHLENEVVYRTNVYENYLYNWNIARNKLYLGILLSVLMMLIVVLVTGSVVRSEFRIRSSELVLRKLLGYGIFSRYTGVLCSVMIPGIAGTAAVAVMQKISGSGSMYFTAASGILVMAVYAAVLLLNIRKLERAGIQRVLKGGYI